MKTQPWSQAISRPQTQASVSPTEWIQTPLLFQALGADAQQLDIMSATYQVWRHIRMNQPFTLTQLDGEILASLRNDRVDVHADFKPAIAVLDKVVDIESRLAMAAMLDNLEATMEANAAAEAARAGQHEGTDATEREAESLDTHVHEPGAGQAQSRAESHRRRR